MVEPSTWMVEAFRLRRTRRAPGPELAGNLEQNAQLLLQLQMSGFDIQQHTLQPLTKQQDN